MTRNGINVFTAMLTVVILVLGHQFNHERHETSGFQIDVGSKTISIESEVIGSTANLWPAVF